MGGLFVLLYLCAGGVGAWGFSKVVSLRQPKPDPEGDRRALWNMKMYRLYVMTSGLKIYPAELPDGTIRWYRLGHDD